MQKVAGCEQCAWASYCNGSCPGMAYQMTGDFNRANPEDCYSRFLMETKQ
jgi:radical SAM protein with 4Fe4S-binding SPASM domain